MKKTYWIARIVGYVAGAAGMALYMMARASVETRGRWAGLGAGLLILSFAGFFVSYALYLYVRLTRR